MALRSYISNMPTKAEQAIKNGQAIETVHHSMRVRLPYLDWQAIEIIANQERTSVSAIVRRELLALIKTYSKGEN
jgi:hypothetical protein